MLSLLVIVMIVAFLAWLILQFTGPSRGAQIALIVWAACVTLLLSGIRLEA